MTYPQHSDPDDSMPRADQTRPPAVTRAVQLMGAGAVLSALSVVASLATYATFADETDRQMRRTDPGVSQDAIDTAIAVGITFTVALGVLGVVGWLWMARKNAQGRAWARVTASVLGGLNVVFTLLAVAGGQFDPLSLVLSGLSVALAAVILVLLWRPESTAFYDAVSSPHSG